MQTVNLVRTEVISQLETAKQRAYERFLRDKKEWKRKEIEDLKKKLEAVKSDRELPCRCYNHEPRYESGHYDSFIKMFELMKGDSVKVNQKDWDRLFRLLKDED